MKRLSRVLRFLIFLWSDPEFLPNGVDWQPSQRGAGWLFSDTPVGNFVFANSLRLICRSHQLVMEGFEYMFNDSLVTIWSAPNYVYKCGNKAAMLNINGMVTKIVNFNASFDSQFIIPTNSYSIPNARLGYFI